MRTKSDVKTACRSVPSQWHNSGDATGNRERERENRGRAWRENRERN